MSSEPEVQQSLEDVERERDDFFDKYIHWKGVAESREAELKQRRTEYDFVLKLREQRAEHAESENARLAARFTDLTRQQAATQSCYAFWREKAEKYEARILNEPVILDCEDQVTQLIEENARLAAVVDAARIYFDKDSHDLTQADHDRVCDAPEALATPPSAAPPAPPVSVDEFSARCCSCNVIHSFPEGTADDDLICSQCHAHQPPDARGAGEAERMRLTLEILADDQTWERGSLIEPGFTPIPIRVRDMARAALIPTDQPPGVRE